MHSPLADGIKVAHAERRVDEVIEHMALHLGSFVGRGYEGDVEGGVAAVRYVLHCRQRKIFY